VYTVALFVVLIAPLIVTALKRHWLLFVAGWLTIGLVWWIASLRLARPDSWWAQRFYGQDKLARAQRRYGAATD
jgi:membrane-associated phospholipid phosphatase